MDSNELKIESTSEIVLKTDDLTHLKKGTIVVDSDGKRYKVGKSVVSHHQSGGPANFGDPDDRSLRRVEANVTIPDRMKNEIEKYECREIFLRFMKCMNEGNRWTQFSRCLSLSDDFNDCKMAKFADLDFRQKVTLEFLEERRQFRLTGKNVKEREWSRFREWKKDHQE